jgi:Double-GTPase 2
MTPSQTHARCNEAGCTFRTDGICLNGFEDPVACPHHQVLDSEVSEVQEENNVDQKKNDLISIFDLEMVALRGAMDLDIDNARVISGRARTPLIILAGEKNVGKTTILTSIYERLLRQNHPFLFAGSQTLLGFEARCHDSRESSGRNDADTPRTAFLDQPVFLHLCLEELDNPGEKVDLLMTDLGGELFVRVANSTLEAQRFAIAYESSMFALVLDGKKLAMPTERQAHADLGRGVLRSLLTAKMLDSKSDVMLIINKVDCLTTERATEFLNHLKRNFDQEFRTKFGSFEIHQIAARPDPIGTMDVDGEGMDELLKTWMRKAGVVQKPTSIRTNQQVHRRWYELTKWPTSDSGEGS